MDFNIGAVAAHPAVPHFAVASVLLTTKVVVTNVSLLMIVWAFVVIAVKTTAAAKTNAVMRGSWCVGFILVSLCP
jgi:hypothetical protein